MLKIKLSPTGKKHEPHYRIVVMEENSKITGSPVAVLGHYHPLSHQISVDSQLLGHWLAKGSVPTDRIRRLLKL